ncbi:MAG: isoleucine--tRNA ligase [Alphaproteobacteria bacterium]
MTTAKNYKETVFLPKTDFGLRANLTQKEPKILEKWAEEKLWEKIKTACKTKDKTFTLHDGPPYANGHLHMGHALNKILKDVVNRSRFMMGYAIDYVPGWDCHGLPIEWKIEEKYRKKKKDKDAVPIIEFRKECREFAGKWVDIQRKEFQRLGIMGDWDKPYLTMNFDSEARITAEIGKFLMNGSIYKGTKSVMWSVVEKTALSDAEVEYKDHTSTEIYVAFPIVETDLDALKNARMVIWTTTAWTIPANRAIAYGADFDYVAIEVTETSEESGAEKGNVILFVKELLAGSCEKIGITSHKVVGTFKGADFKNTVCAHPFRGEGYDFDVPLIPGHHVTVEAGTGFVHTAPSHGEDDFILGKEFNLEIPDMVDEGGVYYPHVPIFAGGHVFKAGAPVCEKLIEKKALLGQGKITHSYPHSWRSKAPLIFRTTSQWFIGMDDQNKIREKALAEIKKTEFLPAKGQKRIEAMVESRPDWCISRQRVWGVPIPLFLDKKTGEPLRDEKVFAKIVAAVHEAGCDVWYEKDAQHWLGDAYDAADYEQVFDIVDIWFESGTTHAFVMEPRGFDGSTLYLEGSDQHRGWFQSSLLQSCGTRGKAPFEQVLTHGFVLDDQGYKMSKSSGNVTSPEDVLKNYGADIMRLWVCSSDYMEDLRVGENILKQNADRYRRFRNTLRYLIGALDGFDDAEKIAIEAMPDLEKFVLSELSTLTDKLQASAEKYDFMNYINALHDFCNETLSSLYFDIRKDCLYCDEPASDKRRAVRTTMNILFETLIRALAPVLCFTAEEAWAARNPDGESIHLQEFAEKVDVTLSAEEAEKWEKILDVRKSVNASIERVREANKIGSSLEAQAEITVRKKDYVILKDVDFAEICIVSKAVIREQNTPEIGLDERTICSGVDIQVITAEKCERCWNKKPDVGSFEDHPTLCTRCHEVVTHG